jgi:hypothetical protein
MISKGGLASGKVQLPAGMVQRVAMVQQALTVRVYEVKMSRWKRRKSTVAAEPKSAWG